MRRSLILLGVAGLALSGCDMAPHYARPEVPMPAKWPEGAAYSPAEATAAGLPWRQVLRDDKLQKVIELALARNQNLATTVASVAEARATYHVERSYQLPTLSASGEADLTRGISNKDLNSSTYTLSGGVSSFELDLFGRLKNQTKVAFESYLGSQSGLRSARLTLVAETATAYVTLASDQEALAVARKDQDSAQRTLELEETLLRTGLAAAGDVESARSTLESTKATLAADITTVAQDRNALELLIGGPLPDDLLPTSLAALDGAIGVVPAGISSEVLLQRPDVVEAEHQLKSANANIGEARAAFFPTISLTATAGVASSALSQLFTGGAANWNVAPSASVPLLGGTTRGNLQYAKAEKDYYLASYKYTVQTAFRDVANALAQRGTITDQRGAQDRLVAASNKAFELYDAQYRAGTGTFLDVLTAQRTLFAAEQTRISTTLTDLSNRITLYEEIGADNSL